MTFNDLLGGKGSLNEQSEIADCVTGVRRSYTCYDIALDPKVASDMLFTSSSGSTRRYHIYIYIYIVYLFVCIYIYVYMYIAHIYIYTYIYSI